MIASVGLFGGYLLIKMFPELSIQTIINIYFWLVSTGVVASAAIPLMHRFDFWNGHGITVPKWLLEGKDGEKVTAPWADLVAILLAAGLATLDLALGHKNFTLNNLIACLLAADILQVGLGWDWGCISRHLYDDSCRGACKFLVFLDSVPIFQVNMRVRHPSLWLTMAFKCPKQFILKILLFRQQ